MNELRELLITRVGAQGDGVADEGGAAIFVPFALDGRAGRSRCFGRTGPAA